MPNAIRIHAQGGSDVLKYEPIDTPEPGEGEIAIRHGAIGLNYIDVYHRSGAYPIADFPAIIGLEGAGTVFAVGKGVTTLKEGDRVAYAAPPMGAYADERVRELTDGKGSDERGSFRRGENKHQPTLCAGRCCQSPR